MTTVSFDETNIGTGMSIAEWLLWLESKKKYLIDERLREHFYLSYFVVMEVTEEK